MARVTRLSPQEVRRAKPVRNPDVVESSANGVVTLMGAAPMNGLLGKLLQGAASTPPVKRYELEEVGAFVWSFIDGRRSFESISRQIQRQFKLSRPEADASLEAFLRMLSERGLITLLVKK